MAEETKRDKFLRLAEARTNAALKQIELIGNLSNKSAYDYNEEDIKRIYKSLKYALDDMKDLFEDKEASKKFKLDK